MHFINFIENTAPLEAAILATLDVCSLYTNIPQEEEIEIVCRFYEEHYQPTLFVPTQFLGDLMLLILTKKFIQIQRQTLPTDTWHSNWICPLMLSQSFLWHTLRNKPLLWRRFIDGIFSVWTISETEINNFIY